MKKITLLFVWLVSYIYTHAQCDNNWLDTRNITNGVSSVRIGQNGSSTNPGITVGGNQLTVEAMYYSTTIQGGGNNPPHVDLVSKHFSPGNVNYLLRIDNAEITTSAGFFSTAAPCNAVIGRVYHVAMVYNGQTLRFYRNGFLMNSVPCSGNMVTNNLATSIGWENGSAPGSLMANFLGYINEVRIWNVARTQNQIRQFMNIQLPNPTTQTGLLGYYRFNSLTNLANPSTFAGILLNGAVINTALPNCNFVIDSCNVLPICQQRDTTILVTKCDNNNIVLNARQGNTYSWSPAIGLSATNIQNPICSATTNTTYVCTITSTTNGNTCTYRDSFIVTVNPAPPSFVKDTTICLGDSIQLFAYGGTTYNWLPPTNINNTTISNPIVWPSANTTYTCTVNNQFGCTSTQTYNITVNNCRCEDSCNWGLTGNTFVKPKNFIGSINNEDFKIRTNNLQRMLVTKNGNVGIGTTLPNKLLAVNGEVNITTLPPSVANNSLVLANSSGDLKSLAASGNIFQYLSGNGTWQNLPNTSTVNADQGCTVNDNSTVVLGSSCTSDAGNFLESRKINMNELNLYFNSSKQGKLFMGNTNDDGKECLNLTTRLEISSNGLEAQNDYSDLASTSGLRFTNLTAENKPIDNKYGGVLSLDRNGDVIWVNACCNNASEKSQLQSILNRLEKLEKELAQSKLQEANLKQQISQMSVVLEKGNSIVLNQNTPNPFAENTSISYFIPASYKSAQLIFTSANGEIIKVIEIKTAGKGVVNVYAQGIASGLYTYSLKINGAIVETKKMMKM
jgi:hypothetical protein